LDFSFLATINDDVTGWIILLASIASFYYAVKLLLVMRKGQMQKSWVYIAFGAFSGLVGMLIETNVDNVLNGFVANILGNLEFVFMAISSVLLFLGFRAQLQIWIPKNFNKPIQSVEEIPATSSAEKKIN
jgi:drug/metabolite transporter (DMT)-like permease